MQASHLDEYFADVLALSHKPESGFYVVALKHGRLQRPHCAITDTIWHQTVNRLPVGTSRLEKCVEQDAVKCYIAKKRSHAYTIHIIIIRVLTTKIFYGSQQPRSD